MMISIIYPVCSMPPDERNGAPHPFLIQSLSSIVRNFPPESFEILIGIDGVRPLVKAHIEYWIKSNNLNDNLIKIHEFPFTGTYGNFQRNELLKLAVGKYISFLDHDDAYLDNAGLAILKMIEQFDGRPFIFKMKMYQAGNNAPYSPPKILWKDGSPGIISVGEIGGHMFVTPNIRELLSIWPENVYEADFHFIKNTLDNFKNMNVTPVWVDYILSEIRPWNKNL